MIIHEQKRISEETTQPTKTKPEMKKTMKIGERDIRTALTNMFHMIKNFEEIEHNDKRNEINKK